MLNRFIITFIIAISLFSCAKQEIKQYSVEIDYGYFPIDSGFWREFAVESIVIDVQSNVYDSVNYFLREEFSGWFLDGAQDSAMRIERFYRDSIHHTWQPLGVWFATIKDNEAHQVEENIRYLKLIFPAKYGISWNGNKYNRQDTLVQYLYTISAIDQSQTINNISFDSVLNVSQKEKLSLIDKIEHTETYAYGIGLVSKVQIDIEQAEVPEDSSIPIEERVEKGSFYYQHIIAHGKIY